MEEYHEEAIRLGLNCLYMTDLSLYKQELYLNFFYCLQRRWHLNMNVPALYFCSAAGKRVSTGYIQLQGAVGGEREGFRRNQANFNSA